MSTKTTFKRLALVTVAALGLSALTTAPSQAAHLFDALTLTPVTSSITVNETATATVGLTFVGVAGGDSVTVSAVITSKPSTGNGSLAFLAVTDSATSTQTTAVGSSSISTGVTTTNINSSSKYTLGFVQPTVAGTYVATVYTTVGSGGGTIKATAATWTITVAAAPYPDATSTAYIAAGSGTPDGADSATITASKEITGTTVATIVVTEKVSSVATAFPESLTVTVAGPGTITAGGNTGRALTVKHSDSIAVKADGASGVSTISIVGATSARAYGSKTVTFFGDAAKVTATVVKPILNATTGNKAILVNLTDAAGTTVSSAQTFYVSSSDTTKVSGAYTSTGSVSYALKNYAADGTTNLGSGYLILLTGVAAGTASITVGTKSSATATTGIEAAPVSVRVGSGTAASAKVSLDKASYAPGEKATVTVALFDATGLPVADNTYTNVFATGGIVAGYALGATSDSITGTSATTSNGVATYTIYMPLSEKDVKFSWTTGTGLALANQGVAGSTTVAISSSAIEAANSATQAALAANDAVDALAATVAKLVASLKAQLTSLTNLVIKIQKKLGVK